ncbi:hypothetical protein [Luteipulveratus flavus]|uniref:Polyhydroxyalkanoate synthesis regulator phasin n=1 Tax=Luteipulveratus flavus TaxID=3031728 RepID=A0ABT6C5M8_9MICO|nr:hypothetical protein [Luteipulveratus sp. YIM 133296]MDF8264200.1 hypothetical protein [Luteipulveratus sp. YIM 133296]
MSLNNVRTALQILSGAGEVTRAKAMEAADALLSVPQQLPGARSTSGRAGQLAGQVATLADELVAAAAANQDNIRALIRSELDTRLQRVGLVPSTELADARAEIERLERQVETLRRELAGRASGPAEAAATPPVARRRPPRTAIAKKSARRNQVRPGETAGVVDFESAATRTAAKRTGSSGPRRLAEASSSAAPTPPRKAAKKAPSATAPTAKKAAKRPVKKATSPVKKASSPAAAPTKKGTSANAKSPAKKGASGSQPFTDAKDAAKKAPSPDPAKRTEAPRPDPGAPSSTTS